MTSVNQPMVPCMLATLDPLNRTPKKFLGPMLIANIILYVMFTVFAAFCHGSGVLGLVTAWLRRVESRRSGGEQVASAPGPWGADVVDHVWSHER